MNNKLIFILIFIIGFFIRWHNISPFKIYPDSYQNLLVAQNITTFHNVLGYLGPQGMLYPDYFMWTRPIYALLINTTTFFTHNMTFSAQTIAFSFGLIAIPLAYIFIKNILGSNNYALAGAALLAFSFNHTVWSGFIMTETTGIVAMLLFLIFFVKYLKTKLALGSDFITGILFAFAILTRYEYGLVFLPVIFLIFLQSPKPLNKLLIIFAGILLTLALTTATLFPLSSLFSVIHYEMQDLMKFLMIISGVFLFIIIFILAIFRRYKQKISKYLPHSLIGILWIFALLLIQIPAVWNFALQDFLITIFSLFGLTLMIHKKELCDYALFVLFSITCLGVLYHHTNPDMERYVTHLIPFLLIPASYGIIQIMKRKQFMVPVVLMILVVLQIFISFHGLRASQDASWFRPSYEEKAAKMIREYLPKNCHAEFSSASPKILKQVQDDNCSTWLLVSQPEPYFYNLGVTTHSIADTYPFVFIEKGNRDQKIIIVEDMGMHTYFPQFTKFLETHLKSSEKKRLNVHESYHTLGLTQKEKYPVILYETTLGKLELAIKASAF